MKLLKQLGSAALMLFALTFGGRAYGQYPEPCAPGGNFQTVDYPPEDGCSPAQCYAVYRVTFDTLYGIACDAACIEGGNVCYGDRVATQSGFDGCTVNLTACPPSTPYYCHYYTYQYDICTDNICTPNQYGGYFCNNRSAQLKEGNRAKALLASLRALRAR